LQTKDPHNTAEKEEMIKIGEVYFFQAKGTRANGTPFTIRDRFTELHNDVYPAWIGFAVHVDFFYYTPPSVLLSFRVTKDRVAIYQSGRLPLPFVRSRNEIGPHPLDFRLEDVLIKEPSRYVVEILLNDAVSYRKSLMFA
jgi:hypothetical protein